MFTVKIKFQTDSHSKLMEQVAGTVETENGYQQTFRGDKELHAAIDMITERELRETV